MAYAPHRSANEELCRGMIDSTYKTVNRDRGGFVEPLTQENRVDLSDIWYGIHEAKSKRLPDGRIFNDPQAVATKEAQLSI